MLLIDMGATPPYFQCTKQHMAPLDESLFSLVNRGANKCCQSICDSGTHETEIRECRWSTFAADLQLILTVKTVLYLRHIFASSREHRASTNIRSSQEVRRPVLSSVIYCNAPSHNT